MKIDDTLSEIFEVPNKPRGLIVGEVNDASIVPEDGETVEDQDYQKSREQAYSILSQGKALLDLAIRLAETTEDPKVIMAATAAMSQATAANQQLLDLALKHKQHKTTTKTDATKEGSTTVTNNAIFVGSTADLLNAAMSKIKPE